MTARGRSRLRWGLAALLVLVATFTAVQIGRSVNDFLFWRAHRDEPIQPWMSIGFVAHSYHVPPFVLERAVGLPPGPPPDRRPLGIIATARNESFAVVRDRMSVAIVHARPPYPPPAPPAPPARR